MVDTARQLLDELMGRNRNLDPTAAKDKKVQWDDPEVSRVAMERVPGKHGISWVFFPFLVGSLLSLLPPFVDISTFLTFVGRKIVPNSSHFSQFPPKNGSRAPSQFCLYFLVKFCPHELFVNTKADLGQCTKLHDDEAKKLYDDARPSARKKGYEDEFLRFSNHMINEVDRKIEKGRQRLALMNKPAAGQPPPPQPPPAPVSKHQEMIDTLNARIKKLIGEAEEAGNRGDVEQAQGLMTLCDQLKEEKDEAVRCLEEEEEEQENGDAKPKQAWEYTSNEKAMEVCEVCGAFLIVGDAQQRIEDHLSGKQHIGYSKLRTAVEEIYRDRQKEREREDKERDRLRRDRRSVGGGGGGGPRDGGRDGGRDGARAGSRDGSRDGARDVGGRDQDRERRDRDRRGDRSDRGDRNGRGGGGRARNQGPMDRDRRDRRRSKPFSSADLAK